VFVGFSFSNHESGGPPRSHAVSTMQLSSFGRNGKGVEQIILVLLKEPEGLSDPLPEDSCVTASKIDFVLGMWCNGS